MITLEICIDVPDLEAGVRFYEAAFGFAKVSEPWPGVAMLEADGAKLTLLRKGEGSRPSGDAAEVRRYARHWTPVHLDFHVDDLRAALDRAVKAGAVSEQVFENPEHGSLAICADPFGHGFCLLERKKD